jgi:hypothetical protein
LCLRGRYIHFRQSTYCSVYPCTCKRLFPSGNTSYSKGSNRRHRLHNRCFHNHLPPQHCGLLSCNKSTTCWRLGRAGNEGSIGISLWSSCGHGLRERNQINFMRLQKKTQHCWVVCCFYSNEERLKSKFCGSCEVIW